MDFTELGTELYTIYSWGLQHVNLSIQFSALDALSSFVQVSDYKVIKVFDHLMELAVQQI